MTHFVFIFCIFFICFSFFRISIFFFFFFLISLFFSIFSIFSFLHFFISSFFSFFSFFFNFFISSFLHFFHFFHFFILSQTYGSEMCRDESRYACSFPIFCTFFLIKVLFCNAAVIDRDFLGLWTKCLFVCVCPTDSIYDPHSEYKLGRFGLRKRSTRVIPTFVQRSSQLLTVIAGSLAMRHRFNDNREIDQTWRLSGFDYRSPRQCCATTANSLCIRVALTRFDIHCLANTTFRKRVNNIPDAGFRCVYEMSSHPQNPILPLLS